VIAEIGHRVFIENTVAPRVLTVNLPFHMQVSQKVDETGRVIAVNYWYDMDYDLRYCYFR
jgi:hypothetical protein